MPIRRWPGVGRALVPAVLSACVAHAGLAAEAGAQRIPLGSRVFNEEVLRPRGQPVIPIYEGWYRNADGTHDLCFGYFNLNTEEAVDIPLGERNFLEPREFDGRQPTHFAPVPGMTPASPVTSRFRRYWCAFTVTVPADFGREQRVWWTLQRASGEVIRTPGSLIADYVLDEPASDGRGELAPILRFSESAQPMQGKKGGESPARTARVGVPLELPVWVEHPFEERAWVGWVLYRGPAPVAFAPAEQQVPLTDRRGTAATTVRFSEPGEYRLLVQSINSTTAFEFHCCWTNGYVSVTVTE
jgi:hypothetical protein